MSSLQPETNKTLPLDVLGGIFSYYASEETIHYPLETMLLVSRSWADAALSHRTLWTHLKIYFGHDPTSKVWGARLPLRLARAGPTTLLDIDIRNYLDMPYCSQAQKDVQNDPIFSSSPCHRVDDGHDDELCTCYEVARASAHEALKRIAGNSGELCFRWVSLKLDLGHGENGIKWTSVAAIHLSYPTPQLITLALRNVQFDSKVSLPVFLSVPKIKNITIVDCKLPSLPLFDNIRQATIGWKMNIQEVHDFSSLRHATRVENLHLYIPSVSTTAIRMRLPGQFDALKVLHISGNNFPPQLYDCQMPILSSLTLEYQFVNPLPHILNCKGFVAQNLCRFTLLWNLSARPTSEDIVSTFSSLHAFLCDTRNLESITVEKEMLNILLKMIWFLARLGPSQRLNPQGLLVDDIWIINRAIEDRVYLRGDETRGRLEEIANGWGLVPLDGSLEEFISQLRVKAALDGGFNNESDSESDFESDSEGDSDAD